MECLRFVAERSSNWFDTLRTFFVDAPHAAIGEIGLDKGSHGKTIEFTEQTNGAFPAGVILHSYMGSAEMVPELSDPVSYFSFSGFLTSIKEQKVKKMLNSVPKNRILIETDDPDGLSNFRKESLIPVSEEDMPNEGDK